METRSGEALDKVLLNDMASYRFVKDYIPIHVVIYSHVHEFSMVLTMLV